MLADKARSLLICCACALLPACATGDSASARSQTSSSWNPRHDQLARGALQRPDGRDATAVGFSTPANCFEVYDAAIGLVRRYKFDILDLVRETQLQDLPAELQPLALKVMSKSEDGRTTFGEVDVLMLPGAANSCRVHLMRIGTGRMVNPSWEEIGLILKAMVGGQPLD